MKGQPTKAPSWRGSDQIADERYYEAVQWKMFSHVCTMPVKYDPQLSTNGKETSFIVTGAQLHVKVHESTSVLHLRLLYSEVPCCIVGQSRWEQGRLDFSQKSSFFPAISVPFTGVEKERQPGPVVIVDSGVFPSGPPMPVGAQKLLRFVDTSHICKGPQDTPGYWLVTGAKLDVEKGRIGLHVKFSLLASIS